MILATLFLLGPLSQPPANPLPQPAAPPPPQQLKLPTGKYVVLKVSGDIDTEHTLRGIAAELDALRSNSLIVLELDGNRARPDLIARLGARIANNAPPVALWLRDTSDKRVGIGQAALAGFAKVTFIDPETRIASSAEDDIRYLAPAETSWESVEQEITGRLWRRLTDVGADQTLPPLMLNPSRDTWAVPVSADEPWKLSPAPPAGGQRGPQPAQIAWSEGSRIEIGAETAIALRLCAGKTSSPAPILTASGLSPRSSSSRRSIESKFAAAGATLPRLVDDAKLAVRRIATTLTLKSSDRALTSDDYRKAGRSALNQIESASRELERAESLLADYPELHRRREAESSGRADKGPWRPVIDLLRKDLDKHRTAARDFASR